MATNEESLFACEPHNPVHELCLCEHDKIIPKPEALYKFTVDENCEACKRLAKAYFEEEE